MRRFGHRSGFRNQFGLRTGQTARRRSSESRDHLVDTLAVVGGTTAMVGGMTLWGMKLAGVALTASIAAKGVAAVAIVGVVAFAAPFVRDAYRNARAALRERRERQKEEEWRSRSFEEKIVAATEQLRPADGRTRIIRLDGRAGPHGIGSQ